jgi:hypothetical protein
MKGYRKDVENDSFLLHPFLASPIHNYKKITKGEDAK